MARTCVRLRSSPTATTTATPCSPRHDARVTRGELVTSVPLHNELASHSLPPHGVPPPTHPHPPQTRTHTRSHMRVALLSPLSHLSLPASHCFPRVTHNRSLHSLSRSPTLCVLDDVTALTHPLAHPLATCSTTSLHSPTRSPTRYVLDDVTALTHSLTHALRVRKRHYTRPLAHPLTA